MSDPRWAANIINTCMGAQRGEQVLIAVDEPLSSVREALLAEALKAGPAELWAYTFPDAGRPFVEFPQRLIALAKEVDAVVLLLASLGSTVELPAHLAARLAIAGGNSRYAVGVYIDEGILEHELSADYEEVAALTRGLADRLQRCTSVHVTTGLGTDLRLLVESRPWLLDTGPLRGRGVYGNLPAGEVFTAPVEDSAEGVLVIDKSFQAWYSPSRCGSGSSGIVQWI